MQRISRKSWAALATLAAFATPALAERKTSSPPAR